MKFIPIADKYDIELKKLGIHDNEYDYDYAGILSDLAEYKELGLNSEYNRVVREIAENDFFFFCFYVLQMPINDPFLLARCKEVQEQCHLTIDLWAREHWKSSLLSCAMPIWELIHNKEERIVIFSHTRALAKSFLRRIKEILETNTRLLDAFPDIFFKNPVKDSPKWSENDGLFVKRERVYNEASVEAWGLVDAMPTGKHFTIRVYDDIVTENSITTRAQREKVIERFGLSEFLAAENGKVKGGKKRIIGTRYGDNDYYGTLIKGKGKRWKVREYPAEVDEKGKGKLYGNPVYLSRESLDEKLAGSSPYIYSAQMLVNPVTNKGKIFKSFWIKYWDKLEEDTNCYILVDPSKKQGNKNDYFVAIVIKVDCYKKINIVKILRDRLLPKEKWEKIKELYSEFLPEEIRYEENGSEGDIQYFEEKMQEENKFLPLFPFRSKVNKPSRIEKVSGYFADGRILLPRSSVYIDKEGVPKDMVLDFLSEYSNYPFVEHDDMLDCLSFIMYSGLKIVYPAKPIEEEKKSILDSIFFKSKHNQNTTWMAR